MLSTMRIKLLFLLATAMIIVFFVFCKSVDNTPEEVVNISSSSSSQSSVIVIDIKEPEDLLRSKIKTVFDSIENMILAGSYNEWYDSLSEKYKSYLNNKSEMTRLSETAGFLYNNKITLTSAKDYFEHVVVKSRAGKKMEFEGYEIINQNTLKVMCKLGNIPGFSYTFVLEKGGWRVDI